MLFETRVLLMMYFMEFCDMLFEVKQLYLYITINCNILMEPRITKCCLKYY